MSHNIYDFANNAFAYNETMGPERNSAFLSHAEACAYLKPSFAGLSPITSTRTSDLIMTPDVSESWEVDALIGQYLVAFVNTDTSAFTISKIADNDATSVTIGEVWGDIVLFASADRILIYATEAAAQAAASFVKV